MRYSLVFLFMLLFCSVSSANNHIISSNTYYGEFFVKGKTFFGMMCSTNTNPKIRVTQGTSTRTFNKMWTENGSSFSDENLYFKSKCSNKNYLFYYSGILTSSQSVSSTFEIMNGSAVGPRIYPKNAATDNKEVGILYHTWHCPYGTSSGNPIHNQQEIKEDIIANNGDRSGIGPLRWPHWKDEPIDGYYCLTNNPNNIIKKHAAQLINAGIDYVFFDLTNAPRAYDNDGGLSEEFKDKYHFPIMKILDKFKEYKAANHAVPKVVPWIGSSGEYKRGNLVANRRVARWIRYHFYPRSDGIRYHRIGYPNNPLLLYKIQGGASASDPGKYIYSKISPTLDHKYTNKSLNDLYDTKGMWAHVDSLPQYALNNGTQTALNKDYLWSFKENCQTTSSGAIQTNCNQRVSSNNQISVVAYYQGTYALDQGSVARRRGRTFFQQFQQVFNDNIDYVNISGWNAWISKRMCRGPEKFGFIPSKINDENEDYVGTYGNEPRPFYEEPYDNYNWYTTLPNNTTPNMRQACTYAHPDNRWHINYRFPGETTRNLPTFLDMFAVDHSRDMEPDQENSDCYYQLMRNLILRAKANNSGIGASLRDSLNSVCNFNLAR